jgi:putative transposase
MTNWAHYRFRQTLKAKAELFPWVTVVECDEAYTSKTCGRCGRVNAQLGGKEVFACPHDGCGYVASRDGSAARNILLRFLTLQKVAQGRPSCKRGDSPAAGIGRPVERV